MIGFTPYPLLFRPYRAMEVGRLNRNRASALSYNISPFQGYQNGQINQLSTINYQLNEMYEREQEESGSRNHPIHHHRIGSLARLICAAGMLLTSQIVWDV